MGNLLNFSMKMNFYIILKVYILTEDEIYRRIFFISL